MMMRKTGVCVVKVPHYWAAEAAFQMCSCSSCLNVETQNFPACLLGFLAPASATRILVCVMESIAHPGQIPAAAAAAGDNHASVEI